MSLSVGIVGLPNVGKSTLFNALLKRQIANVADYPFTTVEPNTGVVEVADKRLDQLAEVLGIEKKVPAVIKFIDIAGLVKGAHEGEGLGNKFLGHIREVDAIVHLVRGFTSSKAVHVAGRIDPVHDINTVNLELALADFETVVEVLKKEEKEKKTEPKVKERLVILEKVKEALGKGRLASEVVKTESEKELIKDLNLLSLKPTLYVLNLDEEAMVNASGWEKVADKKSLASLPPVMLISAKLEAEIHDLGEKDRLAYLKQLGLNQTFLERLIKKCYELLKLITFFTVKGGKQAQAWPLRQGSSVLEGARIIHTDLAEGFIKAEVIDWKRLVEAGSWTKAKEKGKLRLVGKDYLLQDGEVVEIISSK